MAVDSVIAHKLRSLLVTLGILIGITAVLANAAMVEGFQDYFEQEIQTLGSNFVTITAGARYSRLTVAQREDLEEHTFDSLRRLPHVEKATAARETWGTITYMGEEEDVMVYGVEPGYLETKNRDMLSGSPLVPQDRFNAVVSDSITRGSSNTPMCLMCPFEVTVTVDGEEVTEKFRVKGVVEEPQSLLALGAVYLPVSTLNSMLGEEGYTEITLTASDIEHIDVVEEEAREMMDRLLQVEPHRELDIPQEEDGSFSMFPQLVEEEPEEYYITTQVDIIDISNEITSRIQLVLVAIAGISLLVGGMGIANVMLVTVGERTREIGIMKAVGAKNRHVLILFLLEAGLIGLTGGILGLAIAAAASYTLIPLLMQVPGVLPGEWAGIALGISLSIGVLSGLYPAMRASRMAPVEALRYE
jgi:putative ABC transport system permease protein